jgi:PqqA peptide cyclase
MPVDGLKLPVPKPLWLLAELTYRCPLHCVYCSNPVDYSRRSAELSTDCWFRVLREARSLGAVQLGLSGGEPLLRPDLEQLVAEAHRLKYYSNLITSGVGLTEDRLARLRAAGLDHIQLSFQDSTRELNDFLNHTRTFDLKLRVARAIKNHGYPVVLNVVLHRYNLDHIETILQLAERLQVEYLELANTQYYGWAFLNRAQLIPSREQLETAEEKVRRFRERVANRIKVYWVVSDYYESRPKPCMNGWGSVFLVITADGTALPCHQARSLPGIVFPGVQQHSLEWIWTQSPAFNRFRGFDWMREPCASCPERFKDFGGCRCQAWLLTGDAAATDPACALSPHHGRVLEAHGGGSSRPLTFRTDENSRKLSEGGV